MDAMPQFRSPPSKTTTRRLRPALQHVQRRCRSVICCVIKLAPLVTAGFGLRKPAGTHWNSMDVRSRLTSPSFSSVSSTSRIIISPPANLSQILKPRLQKSRFQLLSMDASNASTRSCRDVQESDLGALLEIAHDTGLFTPDELDELLGDTLRGIFRGTLGKEHRARVVLQESSISGILEPAGWTYFAPSDADNDDLQMDVYELYWIGVSPRAQRSGVGSILLNDCEVLVREAGGGKLVVRTSSTPATSAARAFYADNGYEQSNTIISDYYGPGDNQITFIKSL